MEPNTKKGLCSKQDEYFEPAKLNGKPCHLPEASETPEPLGRSARLGERKLNQKTPYIDRALRPPLQPTKIRASRKPKQPQPKIQNTKRQKGETTPIDAGNPLQKEGAQESTQSISHPQKKSINNWINSCAQVAEREDMLPSPSESIPRSARSLILKSGRRSTTGFTPSNVIRPRFISAQAKEFRILLDERSIHIGDKEVPSKVINRAREIILPSNSSYEMDDVTADELRRKLIRIRGRGKKGFRWEIGHQLFPAIYPDQRVTVEMNRLWNNAVTIPPVQVPLLIQDKLSRPQPNFAYGYSEKAFERKQDMTIPLLSTEDGKSYASPVFTLRFPFLQIELRSSLRVAENHVANGGATAMYGLLELYRRISAEKDIDMDMPQYFSLTLDEKLDQSFIYVNVHWLSYSADTKTVCFHMRPISAYSLSRSEGFKQVNQIVKNILDYGLRERLPRIREALDKYYEKFTLEQAKGFHRQNPESQAATQPIPPRQLDDPLVDQRPARRRKLGHPAREDLAEGSVDRPAEPLQSRRAKRATTKKSTPSVRR